MSTVANVLLRLLLPGGLMADPETRISWAEVSEAHGLDLVVDGETQWDTITPWPGDGAADPPRYEHPCGAFASNQVETISRILNQCGNRFGWAHSPSEIISASASPLLTYDQVGGPSVPVATPLEPRPDSDLDTVASGWTNPAGFSGTAWSADTEIFAPAYADSVIIVTTPAVALLLIGSALEIFRITPSAIGLIGTR